MNRLLVNAYEVCKKKVNLHMEKFNGEAVAFTGHCNHGDYYHECEKMCLYHIGNWEASFVTGLAPLIFRTEKEERYIIWAEQFKDEYYHKVFDYSLDTMHDLGFLYSPYSVALYKLTGKAEYREISLKAADELAKRFDINGRYIDAWDRMDDEVRPRRAIVDCMMNLPLLFWAWKETGHTFYRDVAKAHAETVKKCFIREDWSVIHSLIFDRETGKVIEERNSCGYSNGSYWARGAGWAIYGFAIAGRYLEDNSYYELAVKLAEKYISSIPEGEYVPVWDFRLPKELPAKIFGNVTRKPTDKGFKKADWDESQKENCKYNVDTSACAIVACGLMEINKENHNKVFSDFIDHSLICLCKEYLNDDISVPGILKRQNGQDKYALYGDYFFVEALQRRVFDTEVCW